LNLQAWHAGACIVCRIIAFSSVCDMHGQPENVQVCCRAHIQCTAAGSELSWLLHHCHRLPDTPASPLSPSRPQYDCPHCPTITTDTRYPHA
jgi:hypothetical protein